MAGARWLRWGRSCGVLGKGEGRCKASNHSSFITPKNQMENKFIHTGFLRHQNRGELREENLPPLPPWRPPYRGIFLRVTSKARSSICQLCAGCRALQCSRDKFSARGHSLNKYLCQLCPFPSLAPNREFASRHLKPRISPPVSHRRGSFPACAEAVEL